MELVSKALEDPTSATLLGGNAPVMARRFHLEGCRVLLGGTASESLRKEIHEDIRGKHMQKLLQCMTIYLNVLCAPPNNLVWAGFLQLSLAQISSFKTL